MLMLLVQNLLLPAIFIIKLSKIPKPETTDAGEPSERQNRDFKHDVQMQCTHLYTHCNTNISMKHAVRGPLANVEFKTPSKQFQMHPNVAGVPRSEHMGPAPRAGLFSRVFSGSHTDQLVEAKRVLSDGALPREEGACASSQEIKRIAINVVGGQAEPGNLDDLYRILSSVIYPFNLEAMREVNMGKRPENFALTTRDWRTRNCEIRLMLDPCTVVGTKLPTASGILSDPDRQHRDRNGVQIGVDHMLQPLVIAKAVWEELKAKEDPRVAEVEAYVGLGYLDHNREFIDNGLMATDQSFFLYRDALSGKLSIVLPVMVFFNPGHPQAEIGISPLGENVPAFKSLKILSDTALLAATYLQLAESQMKLLEGKICAHAMEQHELFLKGLKSEVEVLEMDIRKLIVDPHIQTKKGTKGAEELKLTALPKEEEEAMLDKVVNSVVECFRRSTELWPLFWESMRRIHLSYARAMQHNMLLGFQRDMMKMDPDASILGFSEIEGLAAQMQDRLPDGRSAPTLVKINLSAVVMASSFRDQRLFPKIQTRLAAEGLVDKNDPRYEDEK